MTQYLILIYEDEAQYASASPEVLGEVMQAHNAFAAQVEQHGAKLLAGHALQSTGTATSVRGGSEVTGGPFVETKEAWAATTSSRHPTSTPRSPSAGCARRGSAESRSARSWSSTETAMPQRLTGEDASAVAAAVADAHRREWAFVLAATVRVTRDLDVAEECVQDAFAAALTDWCTNGVPARPGAWLTTAARRRALNVLRHRGVERRYLPLLVEDAAVPGPGELLDDEPPGAQIPDDRLRLIATCCHPALDRPAQVALTLRLMCGLSTAEVARAFLVSETTMAARITRAKKKIAVARIPYRVPAAAELPARVDAVLVVVHLLFTTGHITPAGDELVRRDLVERSVELARMLRRLLPQDPAVAGLLALLLLTDARRETRTGADGRLLLLEEQDRSRWDRRAIAEGVPLVREALRARPPSRYALQAAIAAVHAESPTWDDTDWLEILALYDVLTRLWPSPVVALNRAVALGFATGAAAGLSALDALSGEPQLAGYGYLPAARGAFLQRLGRVDEARQAYAEALLLTENAVERTFLAGRLDALGPSGP